ncbi:MAG: helix-turn-helix domain-containing protein [Solirubrobacterales bacterium]
MSEETTDLDERLAAALERVGEALRVQLWDAAKRHGLTPTQLQVLLRLNADPPELRRVGALAARLDVTHPTASDALAALRRKGLVERVHEGHRSPLRLTERGRAMADGLEGWQLRTCDGLARLPAEDKEATLRLLFELIAGFQREGTITIARMCATCRHFRPRQHPGERRAHHCALLDLPLAEAELRLDCPEHELAAA